ncbi:MAG: FecR domain-containing protein, partial [Proteobacteria bacterium]|nr:FecR domain-containing protein [Pseudomonadota bacterium]
AGADASADAGKQAGADVTADADKPSVAEKTVEKPAGKPEAVDKAASGGKTTEVELKALDRVALKKEGYKLEKGVKLEEDPIYSNAIVPGFEMMGEYKVAGTATFTEKSLQITRYKKTSQLTMSPAILMAGDEIQMIEKQTATLNLVSKDSIRLYPNAKFTIEEFVQKPQKQKKKSILFKFAGKIRAKIAKRKKLGRIRFKTATAVIGIKGTDFEANAAEGATEVATIEGSVGVSDPEGKGEIEVKAGMLTTIAAGALPTPPVAIPPARLQQMYDDAIPVAAADIVAAKTIKIVSPVEGKTFSKPPLKLEVDPVEATVEFLMDEKKLVVKDGDILENLSEGSHKLTIKGMGKDPVSQTVTFNIDKTAPVLAPENQLDGLILKQGSPISVTWSEAVKKLTVAFKESKPAVKTSEDGKTSEIASDVIFKTAQKAPQAVLTFLAVDPAGNESTFEKTIPLKYKPEKPPLLKIGDGKSSILTNSVGDIVVSADREIEKWSVVLDRKPLALPKPTQAPEGKPSKPQTTQVQEKKVSKKELTLSTELFKDLKEGKHLLEIKGADDFELEGIQKLWIVIDRTLPQLVQPIAILNPITAIGETRRLMFDKLHVKEGENIGFTWSEPVTTLSFKISDLEKKDVLLASPDKKTLQFNADQVKRIFKQKQTSKIQFVAEDLAGNTTRLEGTLYFKSKPTSVPKIIIGEGDETISTNTMADITIEADRKIFAWDVSLNGQKLVFMTEAEKKANVPGTTIQLSKHLFSTLTDGTYKISVKGSDDFKLVGYRQLVVKLDSQIPAVVGMSKSVRLKKFKLKDKETLDLEWNKKLSRVEATLEKKPWLVALSSDMKTMTLMGDKKRLHYGYKKYKITVWDEVGNYSNLSGKIALGKPRWKDLKDSYQNTILKSTGELSDEALLSNRPVFQLDRAKPDTLSIDGSSLKELEYKGKPKSRFLKKLDEPLFNNF